MRRLASGEATSCKPWVARATEDKQKERLHWFHTAIQKPGTLVTEYFYWSVFKVMTHICQQPLSVTSSAWQIPVQTLSPLSRSKMGGGVIDTNCQRISELLYETSAVSRFARFPMPGLLTACCFATHFCLFVWVLPHRFSSKRETVCSLN